MVVKGVKDLFVEPVSWTEDDEVNRKKQLEGRRGLLRERRRRGEYRTFLFAAVGFVALFLAAPIWALAVPGAQIGSIYIGCYGVAFLGLAALNRQRVRTLDEEVTELNNELDLVAIIDRDGERRATKLLQINQFDLKRYYDQTLRQGNQIFYVGLVCILLGFAVIGAAFWLIQSGRIGGLPNKIVVASLGAIGGALANFIAVIYLRMFSETIKSVGQFHQRLVMRDRLNFGNILAAKIKGEDLREHTLADMATKLASLREEELHELATAVEDAEGNGVR
jgi:hypothetical protein